MKHIDTVSVIGCMSLGMVGFAILKFTYLHCMNYCTCRDEA